MEAKVWLVRISPRKPESVRDYDFFLNELETTGQGLWDKDVRNKVRTGDYLGFITGPIADADVYLFRVTGERPAHARHPFWRPSEREVVVLERVGEAQVVQYPWNAWRVEIGYVPTFWPNGTMSSRGVPEPVRAQLGWT